MFDFNQPAYDPNNPNTLLTTPADILRQRQMADALLKQGQDYSPVRSPWQGAARLVQGLLGGYQEGQLDQQGRAGAAAAQRTIGDALLGKSASIAPAVASTDSGDSVADASQPRGIRNNNPLNIEAGSFTQGQPGFAGSDGRFAKFSTPDAGIGAANKLLDTYQNKYGLNTVAGIVSRWAPASDGNNVSAYAKDVANQLGVDPNAPLPPQLRPQLIAAMAKHENGKPVQVASLGTGPTPDSAPAQAPAPGQTAMPQQVDPTAAQAQPAPVQVAQNAAPQPSAQRPQVDVAKMMAVLNNPYSTPAQQQIASALLQKQMQQNMEEPEVKTTTDMAGQQHLVLVDKHTGTAKEITPSGPNGQASTQPSTPQDVAAQFEKQYPGVTNRVEQLYRGEGGMPNKRTNPLDGAALQMIQQVHPDWNMTMWTAKNKMQQQLSSSSAQSLGGRLSALRNAFDHLANVSDTATQMGNRDAVVPWASAAVNYVGNQTTGQRDLQNKGEREAVTYGGERTKFLTGAEGSESERRAFLDSLGLGTAAPPQMAGTIEGEYTQLKSALLNQEQQIREQLGDDYLKKHPVITPEVQASLGKIEKNIARLRGGDKAQPSAQSAPAAKTLAPADQQALDWAGANPSDPRAAQIKARLGVQ